MKAPHNNQKYFGLPIKRYGRRFVSSWRSLSRSLRQKTKKVIALWQRTLRKKKIIGVLAVAQWWEAMLCKKYFSIGTTTYHSESRGRQRKVKDRMTIRMISLRAVGATFGIVLLCLSLVTSQFYSVGDIYAEVKTQNYTHVDTIVGTGLEMLAYESRATDVRTTTAEFDSGMYSNSQFRAGVDDIVSVSATDDYMTLGHESDHAPDTQKNDWWDDDQDSSTKYQWQYRRCFAVDNTASADDMIQYQIYLDVDTATLVSAGKMLASGDDIRFANEDGEALPFFIADGMNTTSSRIWVRIDQIVAGTQEDICMYYGYTGGGTPSNMSNREDVFSYSTPQDLYYVVADSATGSVSQFASYADSNTVTAESYSNTLTAYESDLFPLNNTTLTQTDAITTTHPINGSYTIDGTDNLAPASFAGEQFVYRMDRYTNQFSFIAPWCDATVEVRNNNNALVANGAFTITQGTAHNLTTNNSTSTGIPNDGTVIVEVTNGCPILAQHHGSTGGDSFVMHPAAVEWYGVGSGRLEIAALEDNTIITVYRSNSTPTTMTLNRGANATINDGGSQGSDPAHHVVANHPIGVSALADGDGGEATTFLPVEEMGYHYYIADVSQYIAIATRAGVSTTVDLYHDGSTCGTGTPDDTATATPSGDAPGKVYFGGTSTGDHIPAGACIVADQPIAAYNEYNGSGDEHNIWNEVQNRQFVGAQPTISIGDEEIGQWHMDGTNIWIRRMPITVTNTTATPVTEYQVLVDLQTTTNGFFGKIQSDGGDIRVAGPLGDGTDDIVYSLEDFDVPAQTGSLWVRVPSIPANGSATVYLYYSPIGVDFSNWGPLLWLDAADSATITQSGGLVSAWNDKSGNANHVFQNANARKPEVTTDGIYHVLDFSTDFMRDSTGIFGTGTYNDTYVFSVLKNKILPERGALFYESIVGPGTSRYSANVPHDAEVRYYSHAGTNAAARLSGLYGGDITDYHTLRFEAHNGGVRAISRDNVPFVTDNNGASFTGNNGTFTVGAYASGARMQDMYLGEMIVIPTALSSAQVSAMESYLRQKWITGPTTSLVTTGDHDAVFTTTTPVPNYYIVDSRASGKTLSIISFANNNTVSDTAMTTVLSEGEIRDAPFSTGVMPSTVYSATRPLHIDFDADSTDAAIPIGYAGREFVYNVGRNSDVFSFYAPFGDATVEIQQSSGTGWTTLQTVTVASGNAIRVVQDIVNNRAFKITSDEPILAFHRNTSYDSKILYPTHLALEKDSGMYELYGIGSSSVRIAASTNANVTLYRTDGTTSTVVLDASNHYTYTEGGGGRQGDSRGYHIVADAPIGASSYADADGGETAVFVAQRELSDTYVLTSDTQYMSVLTPGSNVTCRVFDTNDVEVTSGPSAMDHIPPQTSGTQSTPYPNRLHIGGNDVNDPAFFFAGYRMQCDAPVYAYYEQHTGGLKTDETSWLSWPQGRTRNAQEPVITDVNTTVEEGLYFASGFDSATAGNDAEATAEYIFDTSGFLYGDDTYWRDITWEEVTNDRSGENGVAQVTLDVAYGDPAPTCASATYSAFTPLVDLMTQSTTTTTLTHAVQTIRERRGMIAASVSDHGCMKVRVTLRTGDEAYAPRINNFSVGYYVPTILAGQVDAPTINIAGATNGVAQEYRVLKVRTNDPGLANSSAFLSYYGVSAPNIFTQVDLTLVDKNTLTAHPQFSFPPFPGTTPVSGTDHAPFDTTTSTLFYVTHERTTGGTEMLNVSFDIDIASAGGPTLSREMTLLFGGL